MSTAGLCFPGVTLLAAAAQIEAAEPLQLLGAMLDHFVEVLLQTVQYHELFAALKSAWPPRLCGRLATFAAHFNLDLFRTSAALAPSCLAALVAFTVALVSRKGAVDWLLASQLAFPIYFSVLSIKPS